MSFVPSLVEAFKGFKPGQADIVFVSSDRSADLQQRYMEEGMYIRYPHQFTPFYPRLSGNTTRTSNISF